tara:strand:- start:283 stop:450 length:168 start_codon:yes stop_codon:yes gene_type:complete
MKRFQLTLQEDDEGRLYLNLPEDLTEDLSWRPGDHLEYDDEGDGTLLIYRSLDEK